MRKLVLLLGLCFAVPAKSSPITGMSVTELGDYRYDHVEAKKRVDQLHNLGIKQIHLSPRAQMVDPRGNEVIPMANGSERSKERRRYAELIKYIKSKGMEVGIRPLLFVVDRAGKTPVEETLPDGTKKIWWHGNIQPQDPDKWFESFQAYLDLYLNIAKAEKAEHFTLGAELYSMTVGIEDQWKEHPHGFPKKWLELLRYIKTKLGSYTKIHYDINFTDDRIDTDTTARFGGEFARWHYRLVDLKDQEKGREYWEYFRDFWKELDFIGIDMYRSLALEKDILPDNYDDLVKFLGVTTSRYAGQIDEVIYDINQALDHDTKVYLKEVGFRSIEKTFVNPFEYADDSKKLNIEHQAASYQAVLEAFNKERWDWFMGTVFWDASVSDKHHGPCDKGFSPIGKCKTEEVLMLYGSSGQ